MVDAQLDDFQRKTLRIDFNPLDMPPGKFIYASEAWLMCRKGLEDPDKFGIFNMHGLWFVRGNLFRELAALNDAQVLPWDDLGLRKLRDEDVIPGDYALLDRVASLLAGAAMRYMLSTSRSRDPCPSGDDCFNPFCVRWPRIKVHAYSSINVVVPAHLPTLINSYIRISCACHYYCCSAQLQIAVDRLGEH